MIAPIIFPLIMSSCVKPPEEPKPAKKEFYREPVFLPTEESRVIQDDLNERRQVLSFVVLEDQIGNLRVYGRKDKLQIVSEITYMQRELKNCIDFYAEQMEKTYEKTSRLCK